MQAVLETKNNSSPNEPSCTSVTVSFNGVFLVVTGTGALYTKVRRESDCKLNLIRQKTSHKTTVVVSRMHALYSRLISGDSELRNCQIPVLIWHCNSWATYAATSTHITIILESLPNPGDDTLGDSTVLGYFKMCVIIQQEQIPDVDPTVGGMRYPANHVYEHKKCAGAPFYAGTKVSVLPLMLLPPKWLGMLSEQLCGTGSPLKYAYLENLTEKVKASLERESELCQSCCFGALSFPFSDKIFSLAKRVVVLCRTVESPGCRIRSYKLLLKSTNHRRKFIRNIYSLYSTRSVPTASAIAVLRSVK
ncbi:uncharacterized protein TNCV_4733041 [Trichonephila clavipes]|nr:uncharacterized protein TNCV_4733041 [Trichonephila clavipes]